MKQLIFLLLIATFSFGSIYPIDSGRTSTSADIIISSPISNWKFSFYQDFPNVDLHYWGTCKQGTKAQVFVYDDNGDVAASRDSTQFSFLNDAKNINVYHTIVWDAIIEQNIAINYVAVQTTADTLHIVLNQNSAFVLRQSFYFPHDLTSKYVQAYADSLFVLCQDTLYSIYNTSKNFIAANVKSFYKQSKTWVGNNSSLDIVDGSSRTTIESGSYLEHIFIIESDTTIYHTVNDKIYDEEGLMYIQRSGGVTSQVELIQLINADNDVYMIARYNPVFVSVFDTVLLKLDKETQRFTNFSGLIFYNNLGMHIDYISPASMKTGSGGYAYSITLNHIPIASATYPDTLTWSNVASKTIDYSYSITVVDDNDNSFNFTSLQVPSWFSIPSSGSSVSENLSVTADTGTYYFKIEISDGQLKDTVDWYSTVTATYEYDTSFTYDTANYLAYDTNTTIDTISDTIEEASQRTYIDSIFTTTEIIETDEQVVTTTRVVDISTQSIIVRSDTSYFYDTTYTFDTTTTVDTTVNDSIEYITSIIPNKFSKVKPTVKIQVYSLNGRLILTQKVVEANIPTYARLLRKNLAAGQYIARTATIKNLTKTFKLSIH